MLLPQVLPLAVLSPQPVLPAGGEAHHHGYADAQHGIRASYAPAPLAV